jgi:hypothetical protein
MASLVGVNVRGALILRNVRSVSGKGLNGYTLALANRLSGGTAYYHLSFFRAV